MEDPAPVGTSLWLCALRVHFAHAGVLQEVDEDPLDVVVDDGPQPSEVGAIILVG